MRALPLVILTALAACAPAPFRAARTCAAQGFAVNLERDFGCAYVEDLVARAVAEDVGRGFVTPAEVDGAGVELWLHDESPTVVCSDGASAAGCTEEWPGGTLIQLTQSGGSLAHELLHHAEHLRGVPLSTSARHVDWESRGAAAGAASFPQDGKTVLLGSWLDVGQRFLFATEFRYRDL